MGKRYHCDYCNKTMVSSPSIIRTHNKGAFHQKLVHEHYQKFKDPETILAEEITKKPCIKFAQGICQFGGLCRFSHYTREQINALQEQVAYKKNKEASFAQPAFEDLYNKLKNEKTDRPDSVDADDTTVLYDANGVTYMFPWTYDDNIEKYSTDLPVSIKRLKIEDFEFAQISEWG